MLLTGAAARYALRIETENWALLALKEPLALKELHKLILRRNATKVNIPTYLPFP